MNRLTQILALGLMASLALNIVMLLRDGDAPAGQHGPAAEAPPGVSEEVSADSLCRARLLRCQREGIEHIASLLRHAPARPAGGAARATSHPAAAPGRPLPAVDLELQQSVLCDLAKRKVRERWKGKRKEITASLLKNLRDSQKQQQDAEKEVAKFVEILGLSEGQKNELARKYSAARAHRIQRALAALEQEPESYETLFTEVRALFADEDRLVVEVAGARAREQLRASQLEIRTLILAILGSMADLPWDRAVSW